MTDTEFAEFLRSQRTTTEEEVMEAETSRSIERGHLHPMTMTRPTTYDASAH